MTAFRSALFSVWFLLGTTLLLISYLPTFILPRAAIHLCVRFWGAYVSAGLRWICGVRIERRGLEHRPVGPALVAAKHQSMLDVSAAFAELPDGCFVMKKELLKIPLFGWYCLKDRMIPLDRAGGTAALKGMVAAVNDRFADGRQVIIFPEGTRIPAGQTGDYKPGIAALYRELDRPCHLVATNSGMHWPPKGFLRRPGVVVFEFLPPIPAGLKRGEFMKELQARIESASTRLYEEDPK